MTRALLLLLAIVAIVPQAAGSETHLAAGAPSALVMEGSSNVASWKCRSTSIDGVMSIAASIGKINEVIDRIEDGNIGVFMASPSEGRFPPPEFSMAIPITSLRCGNAAMEQDMRRALRADRYPSIEFVFKELRGSILHDIDTSAYKSRIAGILRLAGREQEIEVDVTAVRIARDRFA